MNAAFQKDCLDILAGKAERGQISRRRFAQLAAMTLAGDTARCTEFLMGNHTIAERMFRHDAGAMLYVPLRTVIYAAPEGPTRFVIDQPSSPLSSFSNPAIAEVGVELDRKLETLLRYLDAPIPEALVQP